MEVLPITLNRQEHSHWFGVMEVAFSPPPDLRSLSECVLPCVVDRGACSVYMAPMDVRLMCGLRNSVSIEKAMFRYMGGCRRTCEWRVVGGLI